ncbi:hypothetical protein [Spartinivicinus poritis]|uniref:Solute-binding protein family 3/N-terminal domain-containing protein n=1 Tax=Spartinivicinus poritis TaxID=2994640 RepID=A0ABT5U2Y5_9GAMM|nr:hypothetical protein [Spartinivicinus sp. A2-2]MDE1460733.1 hypothetical protein [Spartinivicinus sp. A2-2]
MKYIHCSYFILAWLLIFIGIRVLSVEATAAEKTDCKKVNILLYNEYPPLYWKSGNGYKGAAIKIAAQFFSAMSIQVNFIVQHSYFKVIKSIKSEQANLIPISNINAPKLLSLVEPSYYKSDIGIYALNTNVLSLDQFLKDSFYKVSAINLDINQIELTNIPAHHFNYRYGDINTYFRRLKKGIFRYLIADKTYFGLLNNQPDLQSIKLSDYSLGKMNIHYAFSNSYPCKKIRHDFTAFLGSLVKSKEAEEIINNAYLEYYY